MDRCPEFLRKYMKVMGWDDLNWLEDVHMGYEESNAAVFDRNINGWVTIPENIDLPDNQQDRDMIARELLVKFQMASNHPMVDLRKAYEKFN
jgi:hypothetical protein